MEFISLLIGWIVFSILAGIIGDSRECGFGKPFLLSLVLSPLIGLIYAFSSTKNSTLEFQKKMLELNSPTKPELDATKEITKPEEKPFTTSHWILLVLLIILIIYLSIG